MLQTNRFRNATQTLEQIKAWHNQQEEKEEKERLLIEERVRSEQEIKGKTFNLQNKNTKT